MRTCLKHAINKCSVTIETFVKLLSAYATVNEIISPSEKNNIFGEAMLEELRTTLRGSRIRMNRDTLIIILQVKKKKLLCAYIFIDFIDTCFSFPFFF